MQQIETRASLRMPGGWRWGASLKADTTMGPEESPSTDTRRVNFDAVSLEELIDSPVIMGEHFRTFPLHRDGGIPHFLHLVSESPRAVRPSEETVEGFRRLVDEGLSLFGRTHYDEYHFLLVLSDQVPGIGLEHLKSSLNVEPEKGLIDEALIPSAADLLGHEFAHSWCGKYRRPAGMVTHNYNTPKDTRLLWVYEGLDTYLGNVLSARSGLTAKKDSTAIQQRINSLGRSISRQRAQQGRRSTP